MQARGGDATCGGVSPPVAGLVGVSLQNFVQEQVSGCGRVLLAIVGAAEAAAFGAAMGFGPLVAFSSRRDEVAW